jgi:predicted Zn-dependent protease with MMP-like domain
VERMSFEEAEEIMGLVTGVGLCDRGETVFLNECEEL